MAAKHEVYLYDELKLSEYEAKWTCPDILWQVWHDSYMSRSCTAGRVHVVHSLVPLLKVLFLACCTQYQLKDRKTIFRSCIVVCLQCISCIGRWSCTFILLRYSHVLMFVIMACF
jgi:hypothetical protein